MKVQELLDSPDKWTQGTFAKDKNKISIRYNSPDAVKWCLTGAILKCYPSKVDEVRAMIENVVKTSLGNFNDSNTYEEVMNLVKELDI